MNVPLLDLQAQYAGIKDKVRAVVDEVLSSQRFVLGEHVSALEREIAGYCGAPFAVGVASGTDALLLSLKALGIGPGDAVVTVPFTFFATAGVIVNLGARPLFVDIEETGFNMDPDILSSFLSRECEFSLTTKKLVHKSSSTTVKAIIPVHLYGQCADMDEILSVARRYGLPVVEDACQALGASYGDRFAGSMGDLGCFSFFPSKNLGAFGDGGMVTGNDPALADQVRLLRGHGARPKYYHKVVGGNFRLDALQAAVLRVKLKYLDGWSAARPRNAATYRRLFAAAGLVREDASDMDRQPGVVLPHDAGYGRHIYNQFVIRATRRDELIAYFKQRHIGCEIYYPVSLHLQECFAGLGYRAGDFPCSEAAAAQTLALPIYPELTEEMLSAVVGAVSDFMRPGRSDA
jgi:dTDP-4-amino-4,6-dideoxygalactose transaminase